MIVVRLQRSRAWIPTPGWLFLFYLSALLAVELVLRFFGDEVHDAFEIHVGIIRRFNKVIFQRIEDRKHSLRATVVSI